MKCEICHKADASGVLHRKGKDGADEELFVCKACAAAARAPAPAAPAREVPVEKVVIDGAEPPPFVENFVKAAMGLVEGMAAREKGKKSCPGCGRTWEQIKDERRTGCPRCYRAFAELIRAEFFQGAYGPLHVGPAPAGAAPRVETRAQLQRALRKAVREQQFEKAAELHRRLDELARGEGASQESSPGPSQPEAK